MDCFVNSIIPKPHNFSKHAATPHTRHAYTVQAHSAAADTKIIIPRNSAIIPILNRLSSKKSSHYRVPKHIPKLNIHHRHTAMQVFFYFFLFLLHFVRFCIIFHRLGALFGENNGFGGSYG
jgi:hypothetical protein